MDASIKDKPSKLGLFEEALLDLDAVKIAMAEMRRWLAPWTNCHLSKLLN
jgi:hypothetical protein